QKSRSNAIIYLPAPEKVTQYMLQNLDIDYSDFIFVDYGSGKGRVLLVASNFPFQKIIGVEISKKLHRIAKKNITLYKNDDQKCTNFELLCMNALEFIPPAADTVFHFYHPFLPEVLEPVLRNIEKFLKTHSVKIYILYLYHVDFVAAVFEEMEFLERIKEVKCVNSQYNWALYTNRI
ncbi:MAG: class I SAM-dependent methyltransferase, partial [Bacteroidales bacterium]